MTPLIAPITRAIPPFRASAMPPAIARPLITLFLISSSFTLSPSCHALRASKPLMPSQVMNNAFIAFIRRSKGPPTFFFAASIGLIRDFLSADSMKFSLSPFFAASASLLLLLISLSSSFFSCWAPLVMSSAIAIRFLLTDIKFLLIDLYCSDCLSFVPPGNLSPTLSLSLYPRIFLSIVIFLALAIDLFSVSFALIRVFLSILASLPTLVSCPRDVVSSDAISLLCF